MNNKLYSLRRSHLPIKTNKPGRKVYAVRTCSKIYLWKIMQEEKSNEENKRDKFYSQCLTPGIMQGCNYFIVILILRKNNLHEGVSF